MIIFPAIDLKDGQCVRLYQGDMNKATVFSSHPADQAETFAEAGSEWLHVVDLNGAFAGQSVNRVAVEAILQRIRMPVQLGGGIREMAHIESWLKAGISRVILGTVAVKNPSLVKEACKAFPGRIAVGIDARGGMVATEGWAETSDLSALELASRFEDAGVAAIIYTDIGRDGTLQGPNIEETVALADHTAIPVIASGGVGNMGHLEALAGHPSIHGVIVGRALYDGAVDLATAIGRFSRAKAA
ncbi:1-(5-phosphoribosyl)-5-[(5-phosphoribosylamino)methylideneamino]imidazole-4-carboxamide isomerase [bacterium]|nr:1-(5-phosphoribosyl)-5-[(5-phosphoribosylamino)methylideneamino]imidazole-4-carboxamide isomerase [bacterium]